MEKIKTHIIEKSKINTYKKLLKWYEEKDFNSKRNKEESDAELEIINELRGDNKFVDKVLENQSSYLTVLSQADALTEGYNNLINRMRKVIQDQINSLEKD